MLPPVPPFEAGSGFSSTEQPTIKTKKASAELDRITKTSLLCA
jgi:hypothetical protein